MFSSILRTFRERYASGAGDRRELAALVTACRARMTPGGANAGGVIVPSLDVAGVVEAVARCAREVEAALGYGPRDEQLLAVFALLEGCAVELNTGEGKTLALAIAAAVAATREPFGVHVATTNDYLAARDAASARPWLARLDLTVAHVAEGMRPDARRAAYRADVTYGSARELVFDHLRDGLRTSANDCVQRPASVLLLDELDATLIDDACTPLVIGGEIAMSENATRRKLRDLVRVLVRGVDFDVDTRTRRCVLTDRGVSVLERVARDAGLLGEGSLFDEGNADVFGLAVQALDAREAFQRDRDYVVTADDRVLPLDLRTGRAGRNRRWGHGLHEAIEIEERVHSRGTGVPLAVTSYAGVLRRYPLVAGASGTLIGLEEELEEAFGLRVFRVPRHVTSSRVDEADACFATFREKLSAVTNRVLDLHAEGRPVLVAAPTEDIAHGVSAMLRARGLEHETLTSRDAAREAHVVARAGARGAITVTTQMAGRGTDIVLDGRDGDRERRGLAVLAVEHLRSRRADEQLRGRAGRRSDPGTSQFFVSLEDDLLADEREQLLSHGIGAAEYLRRAIAAAQERAESNERTQRNTVRALDAVLEEQRVYMHALRRAILEGRYDDARPQVRDPRSERARARTEHAVRRLIATHARASGEKGTVVSVGGSPLRLRPPRLGRELYDMFGCVVPLPRADLPRAVHEAPTLVAFALEAQRARVLDLASEVVDDLSNCPEEHLGAAHRRLTEILGAHVEDHPALDAKRRVETWRSESLLRVAAMIDAGPRRLALRRFRLLYLEAIDTAWFRHLAVMRDARSALAFSSRGESDPIRAYRASGYLLFRETMARARVATLAAFATDPATGREDVLALEQRLVDGARARSRPVSPAG